MEWEQIETFPKGDYTWQFLKLPFGRKVAGEQRVKRALWQWSPWSPILVATPTSSRFLPPICVPELAASVHRRLVRQYIALFALVITAAGGFGIAYLGNYSTLFARMASAFTLVAIFIIFQYCLVFKDVTSLRATSKFVAWIYMRGDMTVPVAALGMVAVGTSQWLLERYVGGFDAVITRYGLVFADAGSQPWRYIVGPFFHGGFAHWLGNLGLLILATGLSSVLARRSTVIVIFVIGLLIPAYLYGLLPVDLRSEAFVGISGGIYALLGWVGGLALSKENWFPPSFGLLVSSFAVTFIGVSWALGSRSNAMVHIVGFACGMILGALKYGARWNSSKDGCSLLECEKVDERHEAG